MSLNINAGPPAGPKPPPPGRGGVARWLRRIAVAYLALAAIGLGLWALSPKQYGPLVMRACALLVVLAGITGSASASMGRDSGPRGTHGGPAG